MSQLPSTHSNDLKLLRGIAKFAPKNSNGTYQLQIPMSPSAEFSLNITSEKATYLSQESGTNEILDETITDLPRTGTLTCNRLNAEILALFLVGSSADQTQSSTSVTNEDSGYVVPGRSMQLGGTINGGAGVFSVSAVTVAATEGETAPTWTATTAKAVGDYQVPTVANTHWYMCTTAGTTHSSQPTWPTDGTTVTDGTVVWQDMGVIVYTVTNDYELDTAYGIVNIPSTGAIATAYARVPASVRALGLGFRLRTDYTRAAKTVPQIATGSTAAVEGKFWFYEQNPKGGDGVWYMVSTLLAPNGDLALKSGSDYGAVTFELTFQTPATGSAILRNGVPA